MSKATVLGHLLFVSCVKRIFKSNNFACTIVSKHWMFTLTHPVHERNKMHSDVDICVGLFTYCEYIVYRNVLKDLHI